MILFLETLHEHALGIDFSILVLIWLVHLVIYPSFRQIAAENFPQWHASYCNRISFFVLPLMGMQLLESVSSCFFVGRVWEWVRLSAVFLAWAITFFTPRPATANFPRAGEMIRSLELYFEETAGVLSLGP